MCLMICLFAVGLTACSPRLRVPLNLKVDIVQQQITWAQVFPPEGKDEKMIRYRYEINGNERTTRTESVSIEDLEEGTYTFRVRAESTNKNYRNSQWSEEITFVKEAEDGLAHRLINGNKEFEVTGIGKVTSENIVIGATFRGLPVTKIADSAFANTGRIVSIEIPESVTSIGTRAFYNCAALTNIIIPESVTSIGNYAFQRCRALVSVRLPSGLAAINDYTFSNCSSLSEVNLGSNLKTIGRYAFTDCQKLDRIEIPDSVESIGEFAFYHCVAATETSVGDGVKQIGPSAFSGCTGMTKLHLGSGLETIGERAFAECSALTDVDLGVGVQTIGVGAFMNDVALATINIPDNVVTISQAAFANCSALQNVHIGTGVKLVAQQAFAGAKTYMDQLSAGGLIYIDNWLVANANLAAETIEIKNDTAGIAEYALYGSNALQGLNVPDSVRYINTGACQQLVALASVNFGNGVKEIGNASFANCTVMTKIVFGDGLEYIGENAFANALLLESVTFGTGGNLKTIGRYAFSACRKLATISLPEGLETIGVSAFRNCEILSEVVLPSTLKAIETQAFTGSGFFNSTYAEEGTIDFNSGLVYADGWVVGCLIDNLEMGFVDAEIRDGTVGIANYAFNDTEGLRSVYIPDSVKQIGYAAFYKCSGLVAVGLPKGITEIPDFCFYQCGVLDCLNDTMGNAWDFSSRETGVLRIPETVTRIGRSAFYKCSSEGMVAGSSTGFDTVIIPAAVVEIGNNAFLADSGIRHLEFALENAQLKTIGDKAFNGCNSITEFTLPDTVETIGEYCFEKCYDLVTANLGGVQDIGAYAFSQCYALTTMHIPDTTKIIRHHAFYWCEVLETLTLGSGLETIEHHAFYANLALKALALPATLKTIEMQAFRHCQGLESLVLSKDVDSIGNHAFYDCRALTVYTDASEAPAGWEKLWNSTFRPIIWNCQLSSEGDYVVSFVKSEENCSYIIHDRVAFSTTMGNPYRQGFEFLGWTTVSNTDPEFSSSVVMNGTKPATVQNPDTGESGLEFEPGAPIGSTLYAVWLAI